VPMMPMPTMPTRLAIPSSRSFAADQQTAVAGPRQARFFCWICRAPGVVADRLENLAHAVGDPRRVMARTDCGRPGSGPVTEDLERPKLAAMAEGAGIASQRLF